MTHTVIQGQAAALIHCPWALSCMECNHTPLSDQCGTRAHSCHGRTQSTCLLRRIPVQAQSQESPVVCSDCLRTKKALCSFWAALHLMASRYTEVPRVQG